LGTGITPAPGRTRWAGFAGRRGLWAGGRRCDTRSVARDLGVCRTRSTAPSRVARRWAGRVARAQGTSTSPVPMPRPWARARQARSPHLQARGRGAQGPASEQQRNGCGCGGMRVCVCATSEPAADLIPGSHLSRAASSHKALLTPTKWLDTMPQKAPAEGTWRPSVVCPHSTESPQHPHAEP
jgi:hypothetical protein